MCIRDRDSKNYYDYLDIGSREKAKACLSNEQKAWNNLMKVRKSTSRRLQGRIKSVYDNEMCIRDRYNALYRYCIDKGAVPPDRYEFNRKGKSVQCDGLAMCTRCV